MFEINRQKYRNGVYFCIDLTREKDGAGSVGLGRAKGHQFQSLIVEVLSNKVVKPFLSSSAKELCAAIVLNFLRRASDKFSYLLRCDK